MLRIVFAAVPPIQIVDLTGPFEVFARAGGYRVELVSNAPRGLVRSSSGLTVCDAMDYRKLRGDVDTLLLPGGDGAEEILCAPEFLAWIRSMNGRVRRIGSICTGAMLLAAAGILDGRRAATHWRWCARLKREFPRVCVESDPIYVKDGHIYTSAGVTAGIDLALALVEEDFGTRRALDIARDLVIFLRRTGGQSQFSSLLSAQSSARRPIEDLTPWIFENLAADLSVAALAARCGMSPRQFARVFAAEKKTTPARYVEKIRVDAARALLEASRGEMKLIARQCGFGSADSMRRSFLRTLGVTAGRFSSKPASTPGKGRRREPVEANRRRSR
jgi:transcriptional regulator GlxA family with amidase domain